MRQRRDRLGLALEPGERVGIRGEVRRQHLDRDVAVELRVSRPIDLAHAPRADRREDLVGTQPVAGGERHSVTVRATLPQRVRHVGESLPAPGVTARGSSEKPEIARIFPMTAAGRTDSMPSRGE